MKKRFPVLDELDPARRLGGDPAIYVCSPYAGDVDGNTRRAERFCRYVADLGGIPIAPHLLFTRFLDDSKPDEREAGLRMGRLVLGMCAEMWVFGTHISIGMGAEIIEAVKRKIPIYHVHDERVFRWEEESRCKACCGT